MNIDFSLLKPVDEGSVSQILVRIENGEVELERCESGKYRHRALAVNDHMVVIVMESRNTIIPLCVRVCHTVSGKDISLPIASSLSKLLEKGSGLDFTVLEPCITDEYKRDVNIVNEYWVLTGSPPPAERRTYRGN